MTVLDRIISISVAKDQLHHSMTQSSCTLLVITRSSVVYKGPILRPDILKISCTEIVKLLSIMTVSC